MLVDRVWDGEAVAPPGAQKGLERVLTVDAMIDTGFSGYLVMSAG
jgi:hypothetical protein